MRVGTMYVPTRASVCLSLFPWLLTTLPNYVLALLYPLTSWAEIEILNHCTVPFGGVLLTPWSAALTPGLELCWHFPLLLP